jgi:hypothetical protein
VVLLVAIKPAFAVKKRYTKGGVMGSPKANGNAIKDGFYADIVPQNLDWRKKLTKSFRAVQSALTLSIGGEPSPQQMILIDSIAYKFVRCCLFEISVLKGESDSGQEHYLALSNSLRHDLIALGLQRVAKDVPSLQAYIAEHYGTESDDNKT